MPKIKEDEEQVLDPTLYQRSYRKGVKVAETALHQVRVQPHKNIGGILPSTKDNLHLETQRAYETPCQNCNKVYIGQTNRIVVQVKEHKNAVRKEKVRQLWSIMLTKQDIR